MKTLNLIPGTPEWLFHRSRHYNASDAPAMMGASPHKTRTELLREMHVGVSREVSDFVQQRVYDPGHEFEALARPLADDILGDMLFPIVGVLEGTLYSASFDGITVDNTPHWEHKRLNDVLRAALPAHGVGGPEVGAALPLLYTMQMEHQCMVSGGERVLFTASEWDGDRLIEARHCWYHADAELRANIIAGWAQFDRDLKAYTLPPATEAAPVGKAPETLPALLINVTGAVTNSNLPEFKATALAAIRSVNRTLKTDEDFADARKAVKWCEEVESKLARAKEHALSQTASIDALFKALDDIAAESKAVRLDLDKLITKRNGEVKDEAVVAARKALDEHIAKLNAELAPVRLQPIAADFAGAIKGKRSIAAMQDALNGVVTVGKIAADNEARALRANIAAFQKDAAGFEFLFSDFGQVVHKGADDFALLVQSRIGAHKAAEAEKERQRAAAEAQRIAQAEQRAREQQAARLAALAATPAPTAAPIAAPVAVQACRPEDRAIVATPAGAEMVRKVAAALNDEPATLKLGDIGERLGFALRADFITGALHITPAAVERSLPRFTESQFGLICRQLLAHVSAVAEVHAVEEVA